MRFGRLASFLPEPVVDVICYPHPTLRYAAKPIQRVDKELRDLIAEMFRLMYEYKGVGLAANQVGVPLRLFVMNETGKQGQGKELVFLNPVVTKPRGNEEMEEGCLSLPGVNANVVRPKTVFFNAYSHTGEEVKGDISGYMARIVQHEIDHLDGVLFIDRLTDSSRKSIDNDLYMLETDYESKQRTGLLKDNESLLKESLRWEEKYC
jgi:peptide deformylase